MKPFLLRFVLCAALLAAPQGSAYSAQACGDFNGDGFDDLAIGVPWEDDYDFIADVGAVHVLYAAPSGGLTATGEQFFFPSDLGLTNSSAGRFGFALAAFDWNEDSFDDLIVGNPYRDFAGLPDAGTTVVIFGSSGGLDLASSKEIAEQVPQAGARFGFAVAGFNRYDKDAGADTPTIAVGAPYRDKPGVKDCGEVVLLLYDSYLPKTISLYQEDFLASSESGDNFGWSLAVGEFEGPFFCCPNLDLAIGAPRESIGTVPSAGAVYVEFNGGAWGVKHWSYDNASSPFSGGVEAGDLYGYSLAAGDFHGDGGDDLAIGVPQEDLGAALDAGEVEIRSSNPPYFIPLHIVAHLNQDVTGVGDQAEPSDLFGLALTAADFGLDGRADLAVAAATESIGSAVSCGMVHLFWSSQPAGSVLLVDDCDGSQPWEAYGTTLSSGTFGPGAMPALVVGIPHESVSGKSQAGRVEVRSGLATGGEGSAQCWDQDTPGISDQAEPKDVFGFGLPR